VVRGSTKTFTAGKLEWGVLGWYEMAVFAVMRAQCCDAPPALELPALLGDCALRERLGELAAAAVAAPAVDDEKVKTAIELYTKSATCAQRSNSSSDLFVWKEKLTGGEEPAFRKTLARLVAARSGAPR
jgi:hypothetical protein